MSENRKTMTIAGVALALALITWATAPRLRTPEVFANRGEVFFPQFTDPNAAASLEVVQFDSANATVRPLKVQNRNGRWTIPSQFDYPTDARDRLATTAAAIIALKRDDVASDSAADHERTGVLDPLDTTLPSLTGRGTRVTVRGAREDVLADVILGKAVAERPGFRYVRQPGQRSVYVSNVGDLTISTEFADWIETDVLQIDPSEITAVNLRNYSLDRATGRLETGETLLFQRNAAEDAWSLYGLGPQEQIDNAGLDRLLRSLARLRIGGVLPKPPGITATLRNSGASATLAAEDIADLRRKGFYLAPSGQLVSNRGEVVIRTTSGVFYTLRFGDVAPGSEAPAASQGTATPGAPAEPAPGENRYMFIMVDSDPRAARTPGQGTAGAEKAAQLRARFAPWYYVITADSFNAVQTRRSNLVTSRGATGARSER